MGKVSNLTSSGAAAWCASLPSLSREIFWGVSLSLGKMSPITWLGEVERRVEKRRTGIRIQNEELSSACLAVLGSQDD